jgi:hypothetical protein
MRLHTARASTSGAIPRLNHNQIMSLASFLNDEFNGNPAVREANMVLLRSAAMFAASVFVFRNFGELFAV